MAIATPDWMKRIFGPPDLPKPFVKGLAEDLSEPTNPNLRKFTVTFVNSSNRVNIYEAEKMVLWDLTPTEPWLIFETEGRTVAAIKTSAVWKIVTEEVKEVINADVQG